MQFTALLACVMVLGSTGPDLQHSDPPTAEPTQDASRIDVDLDAVLHTRGPQYIEAHARLAADAESTASHIAARLARKPAPSPADEQRLWTLLVELAPSSDIAALRAQLRPPLPVRAIPPRVTSPDPRADPSWLARDRALTRGVIATGVLFGMAALGTILAIAIPVPTTDLGPCLDCLPPGLLFVAIVPVAAIPLTVVAGVRSKHRRPLRAHRASITGLGLRLRF